MGIDRDKVQLNVGKVIPQMMKSIDNQVGYGSHTSNFNAGNAARLNTINPMNQSNGSQNFNQV